MLVLPLLLASPAQIQAADALVADINSGPDSFVLGSNPTSLVSNGDVAYFTAVDQEGIELWVSDGSVAGTLRIDASMPGPVGSVDPFPLREPEAHFLPGGGDAAVYASFHGVHGLELSLAGGLTGTSTFLGDLRPGPEGSEPDSFVSHQGAVWFIADDGTTGRELWRTDGTPQGTFLAEDIVPGPDSPITNTTYGEYLVSTGSRLVLTQRFVTPNSLIATEGVPGSASTILTLTSGGLGSSFERGRFGALGDRLVFGVGDNSGQEHGLWVTDGTTAGTFRLVDVDEVLWVVEDGSRLFIATETDNLTDLWVSDGTVSGTILLTGVNSPIISVGQHQGVMFGGELYFAGWALGDPGGNPGSEVCVSDGTAAGTKLAIDVYPGLSSSAPSGFAAQGDAFYFVSLDPGIGGLRLHRSDGTAAGTTLLTDGVQHPGGLVPSHFGYVPDAPLSPFVPVANGVLTSRNDAVTGSGHVEPWLANAGGMFELVALGAPETADSDPRDLTRVGDLLYFTASDQSFTRSLWVIDTGLESAPTKVEIPTTGFSSDPSDLVEWRGGLAFSALYGTDSSKRHIWWTDGEEMVLLTPDFYTAGSPTPAGDQLYFNGGHFSDLSNLYRTDGTPDGFTNVLFGNATSQVITGLVAGFEDGSAIGTVIREGFPADVELFISDGTQAGTIAIDMIPGPEGSYPQKFLLHEGRAYFEGSDGVTGRELWVTDGTVGGTQLVADVTPGQEYSRVWDLAPYGPGVIYTYFTNAGSAVMISDGTEQGTSQLVAVPGLDAGPYLELGDSVFFPVSSSSLENELWMTDGTPSGTQPVPGIGPGELVLVTPHAARVFSDESVVFQGELNGAREWWRTDGTSTGTLRLTEMQVTTPIGNEPEATRVGDRFYFSHLSHLLGEELFAVPLEIAGDAATTVLGGGCGSAAGGLGAATSPILGQNLQLDLESSLPSAPAVMLLDIDLASIGATGCDILLPNPVLLATATTGAAGQADIDLFLPVNPSLVGRTLFMQGAVIAVGQPFLGVASLSNALELVIGN